MPGVAATVEAALTVFRGLGARIEQASPDFDGVHEAVRATRGLSMVVNHEQHVCHHREPDADGTRLERRPGPRADALHDRRRPAPASRAAGTRVAAFMADRDWLICPTVAIPPFPVDQAYPTAINGVPLADYTHWFFLTYAISLTGLPAMSIPCGFTPDGLPVGMQIVGRRRREVDVIRAAAAFQAETDFHLRRPA